MEFEPLKKHDINPKTDFDTIMYNSMESAKIEATEKARVEGWEEGWEIVWEEEFKKGFKEGYEKERRNSQLEIARKMKEMGMPVETICKVTDLSVEEIENNS